MDGLFNSPPTETVHYITSRGSHNYLRLASKCCTDELEVPVTCTSLVTVHHEESFHQQHTDSYPTVGAT